MVERIVIRGGRVVVIAFAHNLIVYGRPATFYGWAVRWSQPFRGGGFERLVYSARWRCDSWSLAIAQVQPDEPVTCWGSPFGFACWGRTVAVGDWDDWSIVERVAFSERVLIWRGFEVPEYQSWFCKTE